MLRKRYLISAVIIILLLTLVFSACSQSPSTPTSSAPPASSASTQAAAPKTQPITVKLVTFLPVTNVDVACIKPFAADVEKRSNGRLVIDWRGGPEVMPPPQLGKAVQDGSIDMGVLVGGHYAPLGVPDFLPMSPLSVSDERKPGGFYDLLQEFHKKAGLYFLGRATGSASDGWFYMWTKDVISKPEDLAGKKVEGTGTIHNNVAKALGATPVMIDNADLYTALERGTVNAYQGPPSQVADLRLYEVLKALIDHPYFNATSAAIVNLNTWNKIPKDLQDMTIKAWDEEIRNNDLRRIDDFAKFRKVFIDAGMKIVTFSPDVAKSFQQTAWNAEWARYEQQYPDVTPTVKKLLTGK
jgi:TRAP-type transport system periplasmic protein